MATMDIQGAFDAALAKRFAVRLRQQGWASKMVEWVLSFTRGRKIRVRFEGTITDEEEISCGFPQGSPASPILYVLYVADLLLDDPDLRFGYADDLCLLRTSKSLDENVRLLAGDVRRILRWGRENKMTFDPAKSESVLRAYKNII